jgi:hypothetical protein
MNNRPSIFGELKRRNVYKVASSIVGWLLARVATQVFTDP